MKQEYFRYFLEGKLTKEMVIEDLITDVAAGLYTYMVMIGNADRTFEATQMEEWRNRYFKIRNNWNDPDGPGEIEARMLYSEMKLFVEMLRVYRPQESHIFQSVLNNACGLIQIIKEHKITTY